MALTRPRLVFSAHPFRAQTRTGHWAIQSAMTKAVSFARGCASFWPVKCAVDLRGGYKDGEISSALPPQSTPQASLYPFTTFYSMGNQSPTIHHYVPSNPTYHVQYAPPNPPSPASPKVLGDQPSPLPGEDVRPRLEPAPPATSARDPRPGEAQSSEGPSSERTVYTFVAVSFDSPH